MKKIIAFFICVFSASTVLAMLPPLTPEQQAAADLAKAKTAYGDKVGGYKLCMIQNTLANRFKVAGTPAPAACAEVPPFVPPTAVSAAAPTAAPAAAAAPAAPAKK
ncbi:MAG: hypothetical protein EBS14_01510 [Burkholderiaceae bacterium]|jgi:hypothetical protein|nr:hypothetical protein [Burkholderiaceae bacterium]NBX98766.1 hypothetical protein [Burkholderiaceae bacterium]